MGEKGRWARFAVMEEERGPGLGLGGRWIQVIGQSGNTGEERGLYQK